jgi:hypothetical protein
MSPTTTEAPADASAAAMDLPMPEPAPVTTATDPSICMTTYRSATATARSTGWPESSTNVS